MSEIVAVPACVTVDTTALPIAIATYLSEAQSMLLQTQLTIRPSSHGASTDVARVMASIHDHEITVSIAEVSVLTREEMHICLITDCVDSLAYGRAGQNLDLIAPESALAIGVKYSTYEEDFVATWNIYQGVAVVRDRLQGSDFLYENPRLALSALEKLQED